MGKNIMIFIRKNSLLIVIILLLCLILIENRYSYTAGDTGIWRIDKFTNIMQYCVNTDLDNYSGDLILQTIKCR